MKQFFVDLWNLQKQSWVFLKNHWKGYLVFFAVIEGIALSVFYAWYYKDKIKEFFTKFKRKEELEG